MATTAADAPGERGDARHACIIATRRTVRSSKNDSRPSGVLMISVDLAVDQLVGDVGTALVDLVDHVDVEAVRAQVRRGAARRHQANPSSARSRAIGSTFGLSSLLTLMKAGPRAAVAAPPRAAPWRTPRRIVGAAHHLAGGLHLRAEDRVDAGEAHERKHRGLDEHAGDARDRRPGQLRQRPPAITRAAIFASGTPVAFDRYGTVRDARGFTSST